MTRRVFFKLLFNFVLVVLIGTAVLQVSLRGFIDSSIHVQSDYDVAQALHVVRRSLLIASIISLAFATLVAAILSHFVSARMRRIVVFSNRIAAGDLAARINEQSSDEIGDVANALDSTAARLERSFQALENNRSELEALLDSMQEAVIAIDAAGRVGWSNRVMQRIVDRPIRTGHMLVQTIRDPQVLACVQVALESRIVRSGRATSIQPNRIFEISAAPMPGGGAVAVLHDVTEVERVEITRRDFIANVSHELRTPLTSISGYVETLLEDGYPLDHQAREFLSIILKNANRMNRLTEDLLALARIESGEHKLRRAPVAASSIVEDALDLFAGMAPDATVTLEAGSTTSRTVYADTDAILQVLANLIENAMKYGHSGKRVVVGARLVQAPTVLFPRETGEDEGLEEVEPVNHPAVEFFVQDFGPGIAYEHLGRIFERFYRVDKARSRESGGTGLGLAIAKHIVMGHGGQIRAESELHAGCTFFFTLPVYPPPSAEGAAES